jgi:hypothetical protein
MMPWRESQLEAELEQAEEVYDGLIQTHRSLGTMLAETIRKGKDLEEFKRHLRDLPLLIWQADLRRTELKHALLERRARRAEDEYGRAARRAYIKAQKAASSAGLEARRLAELRDKEAKHLQELRQAQEDAQRNQGEDQGEQEQPRREQEKIRRESQRARGQGEERAHDSGQAHGDMRTTSEASGIAGEDTN